MVERRVGLALALAVFTAGVSSTAMAQSPATASLSGSVQDVSKTDVADAVVRASRPDTRQTWQTRTDPHGRFALLYLPVGRYQVAVQASGFATANVDLTLSVGGAIDLPVTLTPAVDETVQVSAPAPVVEAARTEIADRVTPHEVQALPLNGRNYLDLALLAPNVSRTNTRSTERFAETSAVPGTGISVAGQRNLGNTVIVDGLSANDDAADLAGTYYSEEVIREFQVITSGGAAEFGRASAGTINVVTQSGTNDAKGRVYGFFRDDVFDARNPLSARKDPLEQRQYGISFGGPVVKDRAFWFGNVERTNQHRTGVVTISSANADAINRVLGSTVYGGARVATGEFSTGYDTTNLFGRVDYQAGTGSRLQARYSSYDVGSPNARNVGGLNDASRGTRLDDRDQTLAIAHYSMLSSRSFNEARAQYTRSRLGAPMNDATGPAVNIAGVANWGPATFSPTARDLDVFEAVDTVTTQRGAHLLKAGADLLYNRVNIVFPGALQGVYTFSSLANFQRGAYVNFQQAFGAAAQQQSNPNLGLFVQDEWRPAASLTIDAGLRYDLQWLPEPIAIDDNNVSPRIGIAWSPGDRQTVVRGSAGIYYDRIPLRATSNALQRDGSKYKVAVLSFGQAGAPIFPAVLPSYPAGLLAAVTTINPEIHDGYSTQAAIQIERALGRSLTTTVGYSYLRGRDIIMSHNINVPTLTASQATALGVANLGRPNSQFGNISQYDSLGDSWFNGLTVSLGTRTTGWGSVRASYTLSSALDDSGNAFFTTPQDNNDILGDKGPSDNDQRHRVTLSGTIGGAALDRIAHGFQLGYVFSYATGVPFNIQTGTDRNNDTNANDRPAGVGRNTGRQPSTSAVDLRLSRVFAIAGEQRLELMLEAFNVLNHFNVAVVNNIFGAGPVPLASFGQPTAAGDPRQMQVGVRWAF